MLNKIFVFSLGCVICFMVLKQIVVRQEKTTSMQKAVMELNYMDGFYNLSVKIDNENQGCKASVAGYEITFNEDFLEYDKNKMKELIVKEYQRCKHER